MKQQQQQQKKTTTENNNNILAYEQLSVQSYTYRLLKHIFLC